VYFVISNVDLRTKRVAHVVVQLYCPGQHQHETLTDRVSSTVPLVGLEMLADAHVASLDVGDR